MFSVVEQKEVWFNRMSEAALTALGVAPSSRLYKDTLARHDGCTVSVLRCVCMGT